jgi:hypothetical protein
MALCSALPLCTRKTWRWPYVLRCLCAPQNVFHDAACSALKINETRIMQLFEEDLPNPNNKTHASQPFLKDNDHFFMTVVTAY